MEESRIQYLEELRTGFVDPNLLDPLCYDVKCYILEFLYNFICPECKRSGIPLSLCFLTFKVTNRIISVSSKRQQICLQCIPNIRDEIFIPNWHAYRYTDLKCENATDRIQQRVDPCFKAKEVNRATLKLITAGRKRD